MKLNKDPRLQGTSQQPQATRNNNITSSRSIQLKTKIPDTRLNLTAEWEAIEKSFIPANMYYLPKISSSNSSWMTRTPLPDMPRLPQLQQLMKSSQRGFTISNSNRQMMSSSQRRQLASTNLSSNNCNQLQRLLLGHQHWVMSKIDF